MVMSVRKTLAAGCTLLYVGGPSKALVIPTGLAPSHGLASSSATGRTAPGTATAVTRGAITTMTSRLEGREIMRKRRRRRAMAFTPHVPGLMSVARITSTGDGTRRVGTILMNSPDGDDVENSAGTESSPAPVDAELADTAAAISTAETAAPSGDGAEVAGGETGNPATRAALKQKLLRKVSTLNRGFVAGESDRLDVEEIIEMLELENPNPSACSGFPTGTSPLSGRWQLLYTTSLDVLSLQINPTVTVGQIFQEIASDGKTIQNIIELQPPFASVNKILGSSMSTLTVKLETEAVSDSRINLKFVRTEIKANSIFGRKLDLPALGVDLPSGEALENILPKSGKEGAVGLRKRVQGARSKVRQLLKRAKGKKKGSEEEEESSAAKGEGETTGDESGDGKDAEGAEAVAETGSSSADEKEGSDDGDVGGTSPPSESEIEEATPPSSSSPSPRKPYFESTYCDEDLRVGRTGQGDVFVSIRA